MRTTITVRVEWCMGHRLPNHGGKCYNLHGHQYAAEATVQGVINHIHGSPEEGMVLDFGVIKTALKEIAEILDHSFLVHDHDPFLNLMAGLPGIKVVPYVPTAECIAMWILNQLPDSVVALRLWETPTSYADISRPGPRG